MTKLGDLAEKARFEATPKRRLVHRGKPDAPGRRITMVLAAAFQWYALMVKPSSEFDVEALLNHAGVLAVVPVRREWRQVNRWVKRKHQVCYSVLPRYVLVGFGGTEPTNYEDEVRSIARIMRELTLVQAVVGMDGMPRRLDAQKVAKFLLELGEVDAPKWQRHMQTGQEFAPGDDVRIMSGPFADHVVSVDAIVGAKAKVTLRLLMGGDRKDEHKLSVPLANLVKSA